MEAGTNKLLIAPARSGSTWACQLLNEMQGVVALDEPFSRDAINGLNPNEFARLIGETFDQQRRMITHKKRALSTKAINKNGFENHYSREKRQNGLRERQVEFGEITIDKPIPENFTLVLKHTLPFTGIIDILSTIYTTFILVRQPLEILASWNSIDAAYRDGRIQPYATALTGDLNKRLNVSDRFERQVRLLEWHFERYLNTPRNLIIRYEDLVEAKLNPLRGISSFDPPLMSRRRPSGDNTLITHLLDQLMSLADESPIFGFYSRESVHAAHQSMLGDGVERAKALV